MLEGEEKQLTPILHLKNNPKTRMCLALKQKKSEHALPCRSIHSPGPSPHFVAL